MRKFSQVCYLDKASDSYFVNEAFTFAPFSRAELASDSAALELEIVDFVTKEAFAKSSVECSPEAFSNQLLTAAVMPADGAAMKPGNPGRMRQDTSRMSVESLNSNNANSRRKLPTLPPAKQLPQIPQSRPQSKLDTRVRPSA